MELNYSSTTTLQQVHLVSTQRNNKQHSTGQDMRHIGATPTGLLHTPIPVWELPF